MTQQLTRYWDNTGEHEALYAQLRLLIPSMGEVPDHKGKNKKLEKLRVASNCYYDLFNNGLCNRAAAFRRVFGFGGTVIAQRGFNRAMHESRELERMMDEIILAAAAEQGVTAPVAEPAVPAPLDVQGKPFAVGQKVARADKFYKTDGLHVVISTVTRVEDGKVYLDSSRALKYPDRVAIIG